MKLDDIRPQMNLRGVEPSDIVTIIAVTQVSEKNIQIVYKTPSGTLKERLLDEADAASIGVAEHERPWSFDGDPERFKLAVEAKRIDLAYLFDPMMAVHTSNVEPLPHQITAVYESMLPRQPLRFVLADDPGAGKTIMAGLLIRELIMRADANRILIVAPGGLAGQWRDEMYEKFGLDFATFTREMETNSPSGNPFEEQYQLIVKLDQMARDRELQAKLCSCSWDLVVFDEAHKLSAHYSGNKVDYTDRYRLAQNVGRTTRHLLLMTATPHSGKEDDFQLFLSLLDADRFYGRSRNGVRKADVSDLMRRMMKEDLLKFDGTKLFPERKAYTVNYTLTKNERELYEAVTEYVRTQMGKADELKGKRKGSIGFAMTSLQRRLASSPEAIYQSLRRRREKLQKRLHEVKAGKQRLEAGNENLADLPEDEDEWDSGEQESIEEEFVDQATAAGTIRELESEIDTLVVPEAQARLIVGSGLDRKWDELSKILQTHPLMQDAGGRPPKIIVFTEHKDTLNYLVSQIGGVLGNPQALVAIHGGTKREDRKTAQGRFWSDPNVRVLVATDAAGEGINLQNANLMINYDLPWNPNRLEQRFGRIHRIGQHEVCHLWNLVAKETREGEVFFRLLHKLEVENEALKGRVFDILGEVFEETKLQDLLIEAIRYGNRPETRAKLTEKVDNAFEISRVKEILSRNALIRETMDKTELFKVKEEMEKAEARKLQPHFIKAFFMKAFETMGGSVYQREPGRFEITYVPPTIREHDKRLSGRRRRDPVPVLKRYERICFTKEDVQPVDKPGVPFAVMIHPGHPLMKAMIDIILEKDANLLRQGAAFIDPTDGGTVPALLFLISHEVKAGKGQVISKRLQFVSIKKTGEASFAGWAPHLNLVPLSAVDKKKIETIGTGDWFGEGLERKALAYAANHLARNHFAEVSERQYRQIDKTIAAVHERLKHEIAFWTEKYDRMTSVPEGKRDRLNIDNLKRTVGELESRRQNRVDELNTARHVTSATPVVIGCALVVPRGLLDTLEEDNEPGAFTADAEARAHIEAAAMRAVMNKEQRKGNRVVDVSAENCGWDITSYPADSDGLSADSLHIEVKGRAKGADEITVTCNEIFNAFNQGDKYILAIVLVGENDEVEGPYYIRKPFTEAPAWGLTQANFKIDKLIARAVR